MTDIRIEIYSKGNAAASNIQIPKYSEVQIAGAKSVLSLLRSAERDVRKAIKAVETGSKE